MPESGRDGPPLTEPEVRYFVQGFLRVLRRYRLMTVIGWIIVAAGFVGLLLAWSFDLPHGFVDLILAVLAMLAGILVVQQSVAALQEYVAVPFPHREPAPDPVPAVVSIMEEIRRGGWRDATAGIQKLEAIAAAHGLADQTVFVSHIFQEP